MSYPPPPPDPYYGQPHPPPQPVFVQPVYVNHQVPSSGWATASLVFGILGVLGGWCLLGLPCIAAVIFGHIGLNQTKDGSVAGRGLAVAGLVMGYIVVAPAIAIFISLFVVGGVLGTVDPTMTPAP